MDDIIVGSTPITSVQGKSSDAAILPSDQSALADGDIPVVRRIERNAARAPDKTALIYDDQNITYATLVLSARQAAAGLLRLGVTAGSRVAVLMHPSPELVSCLLGIHMLGATYVPIDPGFPKGRIDLILKDVEPSGIICSDHVFTEFSCEIDGELVERLYSYSAVQTDGIPHEEHFCPHPVKLDDESHIFFTSGTTGRPKGAISSQRNLAHGMSSSVRCFELSDDLGILSVAGASFSISTFELLALLTCGGYTLIAQRADILDPEKLFAAARKVSVWHFVPSLLARLIDYIEEVPERIAVLTSLKRILTGGDNVPLDLLCRVRRLLPAVQLYVNYGASETNCMVTYWPVRDAVPSKTRIGVAQHNVQLIVLNKQRSPVIPGEVGELFVAGPGVVSGYMHRNDLNEEKFFWHHGKRFFATGDMVRIDENGLYEIIGREDFQIQLNGNRIELLEVESTIKRIGNIKDCVVTARYASADSNTLTLIAYLVATNKSLPPVEHIKTCLRKHLPEYMIPSLYLELNAVPTNHNGKVDRANLPEPGTCKVLESSASEPLIGELEKHLASIWRDLLPVQYIHANSDFFELGGDSIAAVRAMARISTELNCNVSMADIISNRTVRQIANTITSRSVSQRANGDADPGYLMLKPGRRDLSPLLLINGVVEYMALAKALRTQRAIYAVYLPEEVDLIVNGEKSAAATSTSSIAGITQLYLSVICKLQPEGPYFLAGKSYGGIIAIEVGRSLKAMGHKIEFTGLLDTVIPEVFTTHRKLSFRISEHLKRAINEGPGYLLDRFRERYGIIKLSTQTTEDERSQNAVSDNIRTRHQVRKNAIFTTRLSKISGAITLIKARDRKYLYGERPSKDLGWNKYCDDLTIYEVPGDHHSMLQATHVGAVAKHLEAHI
ncbi:AMP-binding protein [Microbulbifer sp. SH-1]|uniref:AMP-binding protein n=1 Tax=Microbulbifer sp. SH-1 TaxID=2681547 RepID=UPI00140784BD|nr:AMP-binding protein [Microbulbifer sp. SH-1]QIL90619.1 AMP-binding protein [Microbulbifer sp. SH-1]